MTYSECMEIFGISDILDLPKASLEVVLGDIQTRNRIYHQLLKVNNYDMGKDWFQPIYESEMSEGKRKGQHFTPAGVYKLVSLLTGARSGSVHEPTAGTGELIIGDWWRKCSSLRPWEYFPSHNTYEAWELSDRAVPLLLLNLSIRGIMATVYHGDVLERTVKHKYIVLNRHDDALGFSEVIEDKDMNMKIVKNK